MREEGIDLSENVSQEEIVDVPENDNKGHDYIDLDTEKYHCKKHHQIHTYLGIFKTHYYLH